MSLKAIRTGLERVSRFAAMVGGLGILFIAIMVTIDVFMRKFAGTTLGGATEMAGFIFAVATALAYPFVLLDRANIRIDVIYSLLTPKVRAFLDLAAMLILLYFVSRLTLSVYGLFEKSWTAGSKSVGVINIPLWIPQFFWVLGFALFTLTALFLTIYAFVGLLRRDWTGVNEAAGVPSIEETIEEETHLEEIAESFDDGESR